MRANQQADEFVAQLLAQWALDGFFVEGAFGFTQMYLTHIDADGNDSPAILIDNATAANRAMNLPEFVNIAADGIEEIQVHVVDAPKPAAADGAMRPLLRCGSVA